jgi:hypothetical protein
MKFKVGDRVRINAVGFTKYGSDMANPTGVSGTVTELRGPSYTMNPIVVSWDNGTTNTYQEEHLDLVTNFKFKVGDRVKYFSDSVLGEVKEVNPTSKFPFIVNWEGGSYGSYSNTARLELVQPEEQEPVPGRFYRTVGGDKAFYIGVDKHKNHLYEIDGEYRKYLDSTTSCSASRFDIVGEWVEEVVLPAIEIKRWAVIFAKDTDEGKRGEFLSIHTNVNSAQTFLDKLGTDKINFEIVEFTGTLPERKQ